jgi:DNA-binding response OmpR family regulator
MDARQQHFSHQETPCRVLIIEDDKEVSTVLRRQLMDVERERRVQFQVEVTNNILEAVNQAEKNSTDIFIVDLGLHDPMKRDRLPSRSIGLKYIPVILSLCNSGLIVYSSEDRDAFFEQLMKVGVDDYIQKSDNHVFVIEKIIALWRRIVSVRSASLQFQHGSLRSFLIDKWRFTIGSKIVTNEVGQEESISITEHELLAHLVLSEHNIINQESIAAFVLKRPDSNSEEVRKSTENLLYRIRKKFGSNVISYCGGGTYKGNFIQALSPSETST